jgi:hypothetical protein
MDEKNMLDGEKVLKNAPIGKKTEDVGLVGFKFATTVETTNS